MTAVEVMDIICKRIDEARKHMDSYDIGTTDYIRAASAYIALDYLRAEIELRRRELKGIKEEEKDA